MWLCVGERAGSRRRNGLKRAESEGWWQCDNGGFVCRSPWRGWGSCPPPPPPPLPPAGALCIPLLLDPKPDERAWGVQEPLARVGRLSFPLALFAYPFYLWKRSPGKEGSHFDPACDLFVPSEKNMARAPCRAQG